MARVGLSFNRKFLRLARTLGNTALARGVLELLWDPCYEAGDPYVGTSDDIEVICDWQGKPGVLTAALLGAGAPKGAGFIERFAGSVRDATQPHYQVHDLFDHCPEYARMRRNAALALQHPKPCTVCGATYTSRSLTSLYCSPRCRQAAYLKRVTVRDGALRPVTVTDSHVDRHAGSAGGTSTYVVASSGGTPKEDANSTPVQVPPSGSSTDVRTGTGAAAKKHDAVTARDGHIPDLFEDPLVPRPHQTRLVSGKHLPPPDTSPVLLTFPVVGKGGPWWHLREARVERWRVLYPGLDVLEEARHALAWIEADPSRRKTAGGMTTCLVRWFNRTVDSPRRGATVITGSLKTAGNAEAIRRFVTRMEET